MPFESVRPVTGLFAPFFGFFLSWWGAFILAALDSSLVFFIPIANDALVVYLAARNPRMFWLYPLVTTAGSTTGAALTYWIGTKVGDDGLQRLVPKARLDSLRRRLKNTGAFAMALPAVLPPPFPLTAFVLTCGALKVSRARFFTVFAGSRLVRFGLEALLARRYGTHVLRILESRPVYWGMVGLAILAIAGTVISGIQLWRSTRPRASRAHGRQLDRAQRDDTGNDTATNARSTQE
jgi:membrane protein YqaA with SNARE-associated domain